MNGDRFKNVNHLVLNCYPDGYSIAVKLNEFPVFTSETILETAKISYEESSLLDYIENEELPPLLVDMIDGSPKLSQYKIWHHGCLILEVRDKTNIESDLQMRTSINILNSKTSQSQQQSTNHQINDHQYSHNGIAFNGYGDGNKLNSCKVVNRYINKQQQAEDSSDRTTNDSLPNNNNNNNIVDQEESVKSSNGSFFILLKPTNISMLNDVVSLTDSQLWTTQDRLQLESQIVLYNSPPLFLEPDASRQPPAPDSNVSWFMESKACNTNNSPLSSSTLAKNKKRLPHKKLVSAQSRRSSSASKYNPSYHYNKCMSQKNNNSININCNSKTNNQKQQQHQNDFSLQLQQNSTPEQIMPPELNLQQFLAAKRAKRKSFAAGHLAKFYRHKKHSLIS